MKIIVIFIVILLSCENKSEHQINNNVKIYEFKYLDDKQTDLMDNEISNFYYPKNSYKKTYVKNPKKVKNPLDTSGDPEDPNDPYELFMDREYVEGHDFSDNFDLIAYPLISQLFSGFEFDNLTRIRNMSGESIIIVSNSGINILENNQVIDCELVNCLEENVFYEYINGVLTITGINYI